MTSTISRKKRNEITWALLGRKQGIGRKVGENVPGVSPLRAHTRKAPGTRVRGHAKPTSHWKRRPRVSGPSQMIDETAMPDTAIETVIAMGSVHPVSTRWPIAYDVNDPTNAPA